jgi:hypothetical protein
MDELIAALAPVGLEELTDRAGLMVRRDRKYAVTEDELSALLACLPSGTRALEIGGRRRFDYTSTYFDTPTLTCYYLTARRRRRRFKLRTRQHGPGSPVFLEVKTRGPRGITVKDQVGALAPPTGLGPSAVPCAGGLLDEALAVVARRGCQAPAAADLAPVITVRYRRSTLLLPDGARATIDTDLTWTTPGGASDGVPGLVVLETKTRGPATALDHAAWEAGLRPVALSKFGVGLARTHPGLPAHRWHRLLTTTLEG